MSRNRMRNSNSLHLATVLKVVFAVSLLAALGLSWVFLQNQSIRMSDQILQQEKQLKTIAERNTQLQNVIDRLKSPRELERRVAAMNLVKLTELETVPMDQGSGARLARGYGQDGGAR